MIKRNKRNGVQLCVVGIGNGGINTMNRIIDNDVRGVDFVAIDTDSRTLERSKAPTQIQIGDGLGGGGNPSDVDSLLPEYHETIQKAVGSADLVFIVGGMGKGTATAVAPLVARLGRNENVIVIGIVTLPFGFEGRRRYAIAERGVSRLRRYVDTLVAIPNDRLSTHSAEPVSMVNAFSQVDDMLSDMVRGVANMLQRHNLINIDFADIRTIMKQSGASIITHGTGSGPHRARIAAEAAIRSDLLGVTIDGARGVLYEVITGPDVSMAEINQIGQMILNRVSAEANIIFGYSQLAEMAGCVEITLVASGFHDLEQRSAFQDLLARAHGTHMTGDELLSQRPREEKPRPNNQFLQNLNMPSFLQRP
jgi:cell division protein FtsZ